uniref:Uncharacterized protein n=1 Tax=viral metagenome TaxID=1070528 RepID=A0A6C0ECG6_9ZZZZ
MLRNIARTVKTKTDRAVSTVNVRTRGVTSTFTGQGGDLWSQYFKNRYNELFEHMVDISSITKLDDIFLTYGDQQQLDIIEPGKVLKIENYNQNKITQIEIFINICIDYVNEIEHFVNDCNIQLNCMRKILVYNHIEKSTDEQKKTSHLDKNQIKKEICNRYPNIKDKEYFNTSILDAKRYLYNNTIAIYKQLYDLIKKIFFDKGSSIEKPNNPTICKSFNLITSLIDNLSLKIDSSEQFTYYGMLSSTTKSRETANQTEYSLYSKSNNTLNKKMNELFKAIDPNFRLVPVVIKPPDSPVQKLDRSSAGIDDERSIPQPNASVRSAATEVGDT